MEFHTLWEPTQIWATKVSDFSCAVGHVTHSEFVRTGVNPHRKDMWTTRGTAGPGQSGRALFLVVIYQKAVPSSSVPCGPHLSMLVPGTD